MTALVFIGVWLAAYRVTRLFTKDSLFQRQRKWWFAKFPPDANYAKLYNKRVSKWGQLIECPWCIGFWVSGLTVLVVAQFTAMPLPLLWWFATSTAVGLTGSRLDA